MDSLAVTFLLAIGSAGMFDKVRGMETVTGIYGSTLVVPCNNNAPPLADLLFTKWKYEKDSGESGDLLLKHAEKDVATVQASDGYAARVSIAPNSSLLISHGTLQDQRVYTCMMVSINNLKEYPVTVQVHKKPSPPEIMDEAKALVKDQLTMLGTCVVKDANPAAQVTWTKNDQPLIADGKAVVVSSSEKVDPATGLTSVFSTLQYAASRDDAAARFACSSSHPLAMQSSAHHNFTVHYPTEKVSLQVLAKDPITEGVNVTLKCQADGNPPPASFNFYIKGQKELVQSDTYALGVVTRNSTGQYKCSLVDDNKEAVHDISVSYLDLSLSPTGMVSKKIGDTLVVEMEKSAPGHAEVVWTKNGRLTAEPHFKKLTYGDAGVYVCEVTAVGLKRSQSFELRVEGKPVITGLSKRRGGDSQHKVLTCEAEGVPEPVIHWSINSTHVERSYINFKATQKISVVPEANLTVTCTVTNRLGEDFRTINVSSLNNEESRIEGSLEDEQDQAKIIVGVVLGLLLVAALIGISYWIYMKNSRQGSWKTGEKENGTSEESKKLEENNHNV